MGIKRPCPDSARSAIADCVRYDGVEAYAGAVDSLQGVIPITFIGPSTGFLTEVAPSKDAEADASFTSRAAHVRLFHPAPLAPLPPPSDSGH
jgi:hypothetical protein